MRRLLVRGSLLFLVSSAVIAGCGDDDDEAPPGTQPATETSASVPEPSQPLSEQIPIFERAISELECEDAVEVVHSAGFPNPENPESRRNCTTALSPVRGERGFTVTASEELGTGAVVDTEGDGRQESLVWALDHDGRFKWTSAFIARPQVGTDPSPDLGFDQTAAAFVQALRDGNCEAVYATLLPGGRLTYGNEKTFCEEFKQTFQGPEDLGTRLRKDPDAEPTSLGVSRDLAFYALATEPAGYRTLILGSPSPGEQPLVIDVAPVER